MYYIHDDIGVKMDRSQSKQKMIDRAKEKNFPCTVDYATKKDPICRLIHAHKPNHPTIGGTNMDCFVQSARMAGSNFSISK